MNVIITYVSQFHNLIFKNCNKQICFCSFNNWGCEQVRRSGSNSKRDGASSTLGEQIRTRWSKFNVRGANPNEMEQIQRSGSKSERDGANPTLREQIRARWSEVIFYCFPF